MGEAAEEGRVTFISPFTAWELGTLDANRRLPIPVNPMVLFQAVLKVPLMELACLSAEILIASTRLPGTPPRDPADRIIIATAREMGYLIVTRDRKILDYANEGHVLALAC